MASLFRRSNCVYYVAYRDSGRRRWLSTRTRNRRDARSFLRQHIDELERPSVLTLEDFAREFLTYANVNVSPGTCDIYDLSFRSLRRAIGNKLLNLISVRDVEKFKAELVKSVSPVTANIRFRTLKAAFSKAVVWGYIPSNPFLLCTQFRVAPLEGAFLIGHQLARLLNAIDDEEFRQLVILAVKTMMRVSEIVNLTWDDVDLQSGIIHVRNKRTFTVKGLRPRIVPMTEVVCEILTAKERKSEFVFTNRNGGKLSRHSVSRRFKKYVRSSGLPERIHFHSLRHTGASLFSENGIPERHLQTILGHSSSLVTHIYAHLTIDNLIRVVRMHDFSLN